MRKFIKKIVRYLGKMMLLEVKLLIHFKLPNE